MRPSTGISADGPANLYGAVVAAASANSKGRGVMLALTKTKDWQKIQEYFQKY